LAGAKAGRVRVGMARMLNIDNTSNIAYEGNEDEDQMFLGCSEPSYSEDTFYLSEDNDRPAWNWDGEDYLSGPGPRKSPFFGLDSWDTYDSDLYDPMSGILAQRANFVIPEDFNWNASTGDNYVGPEGSFFGPYAGVRADLDYTYHVNYNRDRQELQDEIVDEWISKGKASASPWMIFTAGAMGSGKSHALRQISFEGVTALKDMVNVDPDKIKYQLPEMTEYIVRNPGPFPRDDQIVAGVATHNESGFLQELIVRELMERRKHIIVDGSLADADWYIDYIQNIRVRYPEYKIAIVHVRCDPAEVMRRVQQRCEETGRCIATDDVQRSIRVTPGAVRRVSGFVDLLVEIENSEVPFVYSIALARSASLLHIPPTGRVENPRRWRSMTRTMTRWTNRNFWRRRTSRARRQARSVTGEYAINAHLRRFWLLDDTVEDEVGEGQLVLQKLLQEDPNGEVWEREDEASASSEYV